MYGGGNNKIKENYIKKKEEMIRSGVSVLTEKGFSTAGINEILKIVGVPKGSFSYYFENKESFGREILIKYDEYFSRKLDFFWGDKELAVKERIRAFVANASYAMTRYDFKRGCLVGNLGQELNTLPKSLVKITCEIFVHWQMKMEILLEEARENGEITRNYDVKYLSRVFWSGWEGAVLRTRLERSVEPLEEFGKFFIEVVFD